MMRAQMVDSMVNLNHAWDETPRGNCDVFLGDKAMAIQAMAAKYGYKLISYEPISARATLASVVEYSTADRGLWLRLLEQNLKAQIDRGITVWLEPKQDKNPLRRLRGVEVKGEPV